MQRLIRIRGFVIAALTVIVLLAAVVPFSYEAEAATEKAVSDKSWDSVESVISKKIGTGYDEIGMCTGYLYWCLKNAYGVDWGSNSTVDILEEKLISKGVTKVAEGKDGKITEQMKPGDIVIFLQGSRQMHCAILGENGKLYHARSSIGVSDTPTLAQWMALPDAAKSCDRYRIYRGLMSDVDVSVSVTKQSTDKAIVDGNNCYSLKGAKYRAECGGKTITLTTDENGKASGVITSVPLSEAKKVVVKEISPPAGYTLDTKTYNKDGSKGKVSVTSRETPVRSSAELLLRKTDQEIGKSGENEEVNNETGKTGATLAGAVFKAEFYGVNKSKLEASRKNGAKPLRTWYFQTDESGCIKWDKAFFAAGYEQSELYYDTENSKKAVVPLGTVVIKEVKAPEGYLINDSEYICGISGDGDKAVVDAYQPVNVPEQLKRGDLSFCKIDGGTQQRMANIPFMITAVDKDGNVPDSAECHVIVTDANGFASTSDSYNHHADSTNENDNAWDGIAVDSAKLKADAGIWFGSSEALSEKRGALPYGQYVLDELPCAANEGYNLLSGIKVEITRDNYLVELGTLVNNRDVVELKTSVFEKGNEDKEAAAPQEETVLTDRVSYSGTKPGVKYTVRGTLMDKSTGKPVLINGREVTGEKEFTADEADGYIDVEFVFDSRTLAGKETVVFETLYKDDTVIAKHEDINDKDQTMGFLKPNIPEDETREKTPTTEIVSSEPSTTEKIVTDHSAETGDRISGRVFPALILMTAACMIMICIFMRKRPKKTVTARRSRH